MRVRINYSDYRAVGRYIFPFERKTRFFTTPENPDRPCRRQQQPLACHWLKSGPFSLPRAAFALRAIRS